MCNLRHPVTAAGPGTTDYGYGVGESGQDPGPSKNVIPGAETTTMQPTKFGKLLKVAMPLIQGGLAGGFGGNWRQPGSGFQAAGNFFQNQTNNAMRNKELNLRTQNAQSQEALRREQMNLDRARSNVIGGTYTHEDADGNRGRYKINPDTGEEQLLGRDPLPESYTTRDTDQGLVKVERKSGTITPATMQQSGKSADTSPSTAAQPLPSPETRTLPFDPQPNENVQQSDNGVQLHAPAKAAKSPARPIVRTNRDAKGVETDYEYDPTTGNKLSDTPLATRQPRPRAPAKSTAASQKDAKQGQSETYADATLKAFNGDLDKATSFVNNSQSMNPSMKAEVRKLMRDASKKAPVAKRRFSFTPGNTGQQQQLQAPGQ